MKKTQLFTMALGIPAPWFIEDISFEDGSDDTKELHIRISYERGTRFSVDEDEDRPVYDTRERTWRHMNFFQHRCYLHCKVPRVKLSDGRVRNVDTPWARPGSGFTLLFESMILQYVENEMPVNKVAKIVGEHADRLWTILRFYIGDAYQQADHSEVTNLGFDETSTKRGHKYITVAVDLDKRKVIHANKGRKKSNIRLVRNYLVSKGANPEQIEQVSIDMSNAYIAGCIENFPNANVNFDRFHVKKLLNEAMDTVRKLERKEHDLLKGHKYTFLKSEKKLSKRRIKERDELLTLFPTLGHAYRLKVLFDDIWDMPDGESADKFFANWCKEVEEIGIFPFLKFIRTMKVHWYGIISAIETQINNGILESINSKIQLAKRRARGYKHVENLILMTYLIAGDIQLTHPLQTR